MARTYDEDFLRSMSLRELDDLYRKNNRGAVESMRHIRDFERFKEPGFDGFDSGFNSFEAYLEAIHAADRSTIWRQINWLTIVEFLEEHGIDYNSKSAPTANCYKMFNEDQDMFLRACKQAVKDGQKLTGANVAYVARMLHQYDIDPSSQEPPQTYEEWRERNSIPMVKAHNRKEKAKEAAGVAECNEDQSSLPSGEFANQAFVDSEYTPPDEAEDDAYVALIKQQADEAEAAKVIVPLRLRLASNQKIPIPTLRGKFEKGEWVYLVDAEALSVVIDWLTGEI